MVFLGEGRKDRVELFGVVGSHVRRHLHAGENDFYRRVFCFGAIDDRLKIVVRGFRGEAAQTVIAAELQYQDIDAIFQKPIEPVQTAGAGVAALAGVDRIEWPPFGLDLGLDQSGIGLRRFQAVTGGDAIAKK